MDVMVPRAVPPFAVDEPSQVGEARRRIVELGASIGLDSDQQGRLALVVNELGSNLVKHGGGGVLLIRGLQTPAAVEVLAAAGDTSAARQHLATALALYEEMGMARWIPRTRDAIERLGVEA